MGRIKRIDAPLQQPEQIRQERKRKEKTSGGNRSHLRPPPLTGDPSVGWPITVLRYPIHNTSLESKQQQQQQGEKEIWA
jgi:hypothetical protein